MKPTLDKGYLIPAVNTANVDYVRCAIKLAESIRDWHPKVKICLLTDQEVREGVFDQVVKFPYAIDTQNPFANDWQVAYASPFRQTIKLEADMLAASPIDHWWTLFEKKDVVISQGCRDIHNAVSNSRQYRQIFDNNNLPDVYNAITYWRYSQPAFEFFDLTKQIFGNWQQFKQLLRFAETVPSTDVVYAMAAIILGPEKVTLPLNLGPTIVHMKRHILNLQVNDWTQQLVWEFTNPGLRLDTISQWGLVHYNKKDWL